MEILISSLLGIPIGIFGSLIAWWILFHQIVPLVKYSEKVSKVPYDSGYVYRVKMINSGKRDIIDATVIINMYANLDENRQRNQKIIPLSSKIDAYPIFSTNGKPKLISIEINDYKQFTTDCFPIEVRERAHKETLTLDDLLRINNSIKFQIIVFGYDEFSGTRKAFISKFYSGEDVFEKAFDYGDGLSLLS